MNLKRRQVPVGWASFTSPTFYAERWADKASPTYETIVNSLGMQTALTWLLRSYDNCLDAI